MNWTQYLMHEELFLNRLTQYQDAGLSLDRIIVDPIFKDMPLVEKVDLLKKHGHTIRQGSKTDSKFWKDIGWGAIGTSAMLYDPIVTTIGLARGGLKYGQDVRNAHDNNLPVPATPQLEMKGYKDIIKGVGGAAGLGLAAPKFYAALKTRRNMQLVQKLLSEQPENNTQDVAINLIARS